jgi:hypothetical protein
MTAAMAPPSSRPSWSWADLSVAAAIVVLLSLLIFPAVQRNRVHARMIACQNNLREIGTSVVRLQQSHPELASHGSDRGEPLNLEPDAALVLAAVAPPVVPRVQEVGSMEVPPEVSLCWLSAPRPGHHGISDSARGQNVLYGDGRVTFVSTGWERPPGDDWSPDPIPVLPAAAITDLRP